MTVRLTVYKDAFPAALVRDAVALWPKDDWSGWLVYASPLEKKRTCCDWELMPAPCRELLGLMAVFITENGCGMPDLSLYGAGMHSMGCGDHLAIHLDADLHPRLRLRRAANFILFLDDWREDWGGDLRLYDRDMRLTQACFPASNRLVEFATDDESFHGIPEPLRCPVGMQRKSLAIYCWGRRDASWTPKRPRAMFAITNIQ